jgi:transcription antitermination factor NusG
MEHKWYVLNVHSGKEDFVAEKIKMMIAAQNAQNVISELSIPKQSKIVIKDGKKEIKKKEAELKDTMTKRANEEIEKIKSKAKKPRDAKLYKKLETIIIDEISMVRADLLDCIDVFLRMYGPKMGEPFGGVQMIFIGDLYQLPPVVSDHERDIFTTHYSTPFFFSAHALKDVRLQIVELEKVYRQKDQDFVELLNRIRNNSIENDDIDRLNSRFILDAPPANENFYINLTTTNKKADEINEEHLDAIKSKTYNAAAQTTGDFGKEYFPTATSLKFKVGSQIMMLNNDQKKRWVNGSIGIVEAVKTNKNGEQYVSVLLHGNDTADERIVSVNPHTWEVFRFSVEGNDIISEPVGTFTQYPFRLAWAITIHKSQGKTFDNVIIDIGKGTFVSGQMYVALSRCTSFEGILLKTPIKKHNIRTDFRISSFLTKYQYEESAKEFSFEDKLALIEQAIKEKSKLDMTYLKANDTKTQRTIIPLTVGTEDYQGKKFPGMLAFCTNRKEERMFHVGRILKLAKVV